MGILKKKKKNKHNKKLQKNSKKKKKKTERKSNMDSKMGMVTVLMVSMLVVSVLGDTNSTEPVLSDCAKQCMPVCLKEDGATIPMCETACVSYCKQTSSGRSG